MLKKWGRFKLPKSGSEEGRTLFWTCEQIQELMGFRKPAWTNRKHLQTPAHISIIMPNSPHVHVVPHTRREETLSNKMHQQGKGKLFLLAPFAISMLHVFLVSYPFECDCVFDRKGFGRSVGEQKLNYLKLLWSDLFPGLTCSGQDIANPVRSDGVDIYLVRTHNLGTDRNLS